MNSHKPLFILAGNAPYTNRGCEAIIRGTVKIIRRHFNDPNFVVLSFFPSERQFQFQKDNECDNKIIHKKAYIWGGSKFARLRSKMLITALTKKQREKLIYKEILPDINQAMAVLSVGGDNYSLDYGIPRSFTDLDDLVMRTEKPMIIWGASVGPFSSLKKYEDYMSGHLKGVSGVFVRDSSSFNYLSGLGLRDNLYRVGGPAFLLDPIKPSLNKFDKEILPNSLGINFSPLLMGYTHYKDLNKFAELCARILVKIVEDCKLPIWLVPHVTCPHSNDHDFMKKIFGLAGVDLGINILPDNLDAAETKWAISRMSYFVGARAHSVVSALSSQVPSISFSYSMKGKSLVKDFYGDTEFSLTPRELSPEKVVLKLKKLIDGQNMLKDKIGIQLQSIEDLAYKAGEYLKKICA